MSLVSPADVRVLVQTSVQDTDLQALIDRAEAEVLRYYGTHYVQGQTVTELLDSRGMRSLFLRRRITSVTSVTEKTLDGSLSYTLQSTGYHVWGTQGRVERLPRGTPWEDLVEIVYTPADDNEYRRAVIIDLVRLYLHRTAMQSESVGGEYSYSAPAWEPERASILTRLLLR